MAKAPLVEFVKVRDGFLYCNHYADGDVVRLTESQAAYPLKGGIIARKPAPKPAPAASAPVSADVPARSASKIK